MEDLVHLIYASALSNTVGANDIKQLLHKCRQNNTKLNISGMLLLSEGNFFQVLEGEEKTINALLNKIKLDSRHKNIVEIIREPIPNRSFQDWSMGFAQASAYELQQLEGLNDFFEQGHCFTDIDSGRAKKLLKAFAQGHWRQSLN